MGGKPKPFTALTNESFPIWGFSALWFDSISSQNIIKIEKTHTPKKRIRKFSRMKGVKIMAKIKYITRTQTTTRIKVFWFSSETDTVENYETVIPGKHTPESALKYIKDYDKNIAGAASENFVPVKCEIISEEKALYRVAETEFYAIAEKVPSKQ